MPKDRVNEKECLPACHVNAPRAGIIAPTMGKRVKSGQSAYVIHLRVIGLLVTLTAIAGCANQRFAAPDPGFTRQDLPKVADSFVQMPISVSMSTIQDALNSTVPVAADEPKYNLQVNGGADAGIDKEGASIGYHFERGPISLTQVGGKLNATTAAQYWVAVQTRGKAPPAAAAASCIFAFWTCAVALVTQAAPPIIPLSCGENGDWRKFSLSASASAHVNSDWSLSVIKESVAANPLNQCSTLCIGPICLVDVTEKIKERAEGIIGSAIDNVGPQLNSQLKLREHAAELWSQGGAPMQVADNLWLTVNPVGISASPIEVTSSEVHTTVTLVARPNIYYGPKPSANTTALPLITAGPELGSAFSVNTPISADLRSLQDLINKELAKTGYGNIEKSINVKSVELWAYGKKVVLKVSFSGHLNIRHTYDFTGYLYGTPKYDEHTGVLSVPDLDYSAETAGFFTNLAVKVGDVFAHDLIKEKLRAAAVLDVSTQLKTLKENLSTATNRAYGPIHLKGSIDGLDFAGVYTEPSSQIIQTYFQVHGRLAASIQ